MKQIKFLATLFAFVLSVGFTSCDGGGDPEPSLPGYQDFYMQVSVSGGGLPAHMLTALESELNAQLLEYTLEGWTEADAIEFFDEYMEVMAYEFYYGMSDVKGTLKMVFFLKTTKGEVVKKITLNVTDSEAWLS